MKNKDKWQFLGKYVTYDMYVYLLDKYMLRTYYMPGVVLNNGI